MEKTIAHIRRGLSDEKTRIAFFTYLLFFLPRFTEWKGDREMHFHVRQALGLLMTALALQGIISILGYWGMPLWRVWPVRLIILYLLFVGWKNVLSGMLTPLPWIGKYAERAF